MMPGMGQSPIRELNQEMQPQRVHHLAPGGPRDQATGAIDQLQQMRGGMPNTSEYGTARNKASAGISSIQGQVNMMDIAHHLLNTGKMTEQEVMQFMEDFKRQSGAGVDAATMGRDVPNMGAPSY